MFINSRGGIVIFSESKFQIMLSRNNYFTKLRKNNDIQTKGHEIKDEQIPKYRYFS